MSAAKPPVPPQTYTGILNQGVSDNHPEDSKPGGI